VGQQGDEALRRLLRNIEKFSEKYRQKYLERWSNEPLLTDWYSALRFFFNHTLYQGRSDVVSKKVEDAVFDVCDQTSIEEGFRSGDWGELENRLRVRIGKKEDDNEGKVGKGADVRHVICSLEFLRTNIPHRNIVKYTVEGIQAGGLRKLYDDLDEIELIGDKIASFYLRDVVSLFNLYPYVPQGCLKLLFPIDTWVRKFIKEQFPALKEKSDAEKKQGILGICNKYGVSPVRLNQGIWYISYNCHDVFMKIFRQEDVNLETIER